jgi:hypothetical protein
MESKGDHFATREEAIGFYKSNFKNLEDKPDWMIEAMIDFCIKYPLYHEYIEVERKVKESIPLSDHEMEKYGSLSWDKQLKQYMKNEVLHDMVSIHNPGEYDDLAHDTVALDRMNKYGLDIAKSLEPLDHVTIKMSTKDETVTMTAPVVDLNNGVYSSIVINKKKILTNV